jgi:ribonuclease BN (tRNA processing enzyme)
MSPFAAQPFTCDSVEALATKLARRRRILFTGEIGAGKSTLAIRLLRFIVNQGGRCKLLELDPGTPPPEIPGIPGTLCLAEAVGDTLIRRDFQALCTLDGGRFRLPLILAARRLLTGIEGENETDTIVLIDPPGVVRGVGGAEMLMALTESLAVDTVIAIHREDAPILLAEEYAALQVEVLHLAASPAAKARPRLEQLELRTRLWDDFLANATEERIELDRLPILGTPPPRDALEAWAGRQAALLDAAGDTVRMGEVIKLCDGELTLKMVPGKTTEPVALLMRDGGRSATGRLETMRRVEPAPTARRAPIEMTPPLISPQSGSEPVSSNLGPAWATLVGGVFGDPLVHVRLRRQKQSLLFDLGDPARLAAKVAHQVTAIFLSHAHIDHIGGFPWFLRSRIGPFPPCRIFGPPETIRRIESFLNAVTWDRIDDRGPVFEVFEIDERSLRSARLQPGKKKIDLERIPIADGVVLRQESFTIKAAVCDHGIPSIAYALLLPREITIRKERLAAARLPPGPWLGSLKKCISADTPDAEIALPDGRTAMAGDLAKELTIIRPGKKLAYAADMADTPENRKKVTELARSAHTFFCESAFTMADKAKALATQHLTTLAAVTIARDAGVEQLIPFHFSKRYEHNSGPIYDEILAAAGPVQVLGHFR